MEISAFGFLLGLLLLALPVYICLAFDLRLLKRFGMSLLRMALAIGALAVLVGFLIRYDRVWLNIAAALALALVSAAASVMRSGLSHRRLLLPVMAAAVIPIFVLVPYMLLLVLSINTPFSARTIIPLTVLTTAPASALVARALRTYYIGLEHHGQLYRYLLGNGATHHEAVRHFMRRAFQTCLLPAMGRMKYLLISSAPVLMLALVMSGVGVWTAAVMEIFLTLAVVVYVVSTFWLAVLLSRRYTFDAYERLRPMKHLAPDTSSDTPDVTPSDL